MTNSTISPIDLNTVDVDVLVEKLKISPQLANQIIALRPYQSVEQLNKIPGIDPMALQRIIPLVSVTQPEIIPDLTVEGSPISPDIAHLPAEQEPKINPQAPESKPALSSALAPDSSPPFPKDRLRLKDFYPFQYKKWLLYLIGLFVVTWTAFYVYRQSDVGETTFFIQGICFLLAFIWLMITSHNVILTLSHFKLDQIRIHPAWLLVLVAVVLRYYSYSIFPPVNQTGFEEMQAGSGAYDILLTRVLPIEFRFTNLMGAFGLSTGSGLILSSLRYPFKIAGIIGLILIVFSLRSLKTSWIPTLLIIFIAATMRFLVIASGVADELFASIPILTAFLFCIIKSENTKTSRSFWLAVAGILAGILMFEYTSYRMSIVVFGIWLFWKCVYKSEGEENHPGSSAWFNFLSFVIPLILMTLPTLMQTIRYPDSSVLFEAFYRHGIERSSIFSERSLFELKNLTLGLTGWPAEVSAYYTPVGEPVVLPAVGWLFGISCVFGLFFMGRGIPRALALTVLLTIFSASFFANDVNIGRMAPVFPLLLLLSGVFLEKIYQKMTQWIKSFQSGKVITFLIPNRFLVEQKASTESEVFQVNMIESKEFAPLYYRQVSVNMQKIGQLAIKTLASISFILLICQVTLANLDSLKRMPEDPRVINEFVNDDYSVCAYIGVNINLHQRVYIYSPDGNDPCASDPSEGWYFGNYQPEIHHVEEQFISPSVLVPGDMVVMGTRNLGLTNEEISQLVNLGMATNSLTSLQFSKNLAGRITVASICFQCDASMTE